MVRLPQDVKHNYQQILLNKNINKFELKDYFKYLRFYLDFCNKYNFQCNNEFSFPHFNQKLKEKGQNNNQCNQAKMQLIYIINYSK